MTLPHRIRLLAGATLLALGAAARAEPTTTVVEFYNTTLRHYFMTASTAEASAIDGGSAGPGWSRTGGRFSAYANTGEATGLLAVCRFYGSTAIDPATGQRRGPNSHFYTSNAAECAQVKLDPGWTYEGIAFYINGLTGPGCATGTQAVYRTYNNGYTRNDSNHRYTTDLTVQQKMARQGNANEGAVMCAPLSVAQVEADAVRLLEQATFGATDAELARVKTLGTAGWIEDQFSTPATKFPVYPFFPFTRPDSCVNATQPPYTADSFCQRDNYSLFQLQRQFFLQAIGGADQLRQRVGFALSQLFVISAIEGGLNQPYGMAEFQQMLRDNAFGNFEDLLTRVTLHPTMGKYLDMANNNKPVNGVQPNENYAREIMQLFSIGQVKLNLDGTPVVDTAGKPAPAYGQDEIGGFAHVFTGWSYPPAPGQTARFNNVPYFSGAMQAFASNHDTSAKQLLGATAAAGLTAEADLANAIHNIFTHPNVGPFIGQQLIQKLVTGTPSPEYVARVAAVFNDNGSGVRGDMKAVVRAILNDQEARGDLKIDSAYGKLREPALYLASVYRAFAGQTDGVFFQQVAGGLLQPIYTSPTVFNYYPPDYFVPGTSVLGPEFAIQNSSTALGRINTANTLVYSTLIAPATQVFDATGTALNFGALQALAGDPAALVAKLDALLLHRTMSTAMKNGIVTAVNAVAASDTLNRARMAAYLVATSSQYQVQR